jgi:hypothetical protein
MTQGTLNPQAGVVACMLPPHPQQPAMALGIGTMNEELVERKAEFLALIEKSLEAFQHGGQIAAPDDEPA